METTLHPEEVRLLTDQDVTGVLAVTEMMYRQYQERYGDENVGGYNVFEETMDRYIRRGRVYLFSEDRGFAVIMPSANKLLSKRLHESTIVEFYLHPEYRDTTFAYRALNWILLNAAPDDRIIGVTEMGSASYSGSVDRFPIKSVVFIYKERGESCQEWNPPYSPR